MNVRDERPGDIEAVERLTYRAFDGHPHHAPGAEPTEHLILARLRAAGAMTLSLVAEDASGVVGHIAFSAVTIDGAVSGWYGLGPVSVEPKRQGEGIGGVLIRHGLAALRDAGADGVVLLGEPGYYERFGFRQHPGLTLPGVPAEYFLALPLRHGVALPQGEVAYHDAFQ